MGKRGGRAAERDYSMDRRQGLCNTAHLFTPCSLHMCANVHPNTAHSTHPLFTCEQMSCRDCCKQIGLGGCRCLLPPATFQGRTLTRPVEWPAALSLARGQSALSPHPLPHPAPGRSLQRRCQDDGWGEGGSRAGLRAHRMSCSCEAHF